VKEKKGNNVEAGWGNGRKGRNKDRGSDPCNSPETTTQKKRAQWNIRGGGGESKKRRWEKKRRREGREGRDPIWMKRKRTKPIRTGKKKEGRGKDGGDAVC